MASDALAGHPMPCLILMPRFVAAMLSWGPSLPPHDNKQQQQEQEQQQQQQQGQQATAGASLRQQQRAPQSELSTVLPCAY